MNSLSYIPTYIGYRIKLLIAVEKNLRFETRNEILVPTLYETLKQARGNIVADIQHRLKDSFYFRSQKTGYDLVKYTNEAAVNTYLAYRVVPVKSPYQKELEKQPI